MIEADGDPTKVVLRGGCADGGWSLDTVVEGDTVREVLGYVQFDAEEMKARMRRSVERAIRAGRLTVKEGNLVRRFYQEALEGYTYPEQAQGHPHRGNTSTSRL